MEALAAGRLEDAKVHLLSEITTAKAANSPAMLAGFAQRLGSVLLRQGDRVSAIALYELSECLDPGSQLARLDYAKFLLNELGDLPAAAMRAEAILAELKNAPFAETDNDFSSDHYIAAAESVLTSATKANSEP